MQDTRSIGSALALVALVAIFACVIGVSRCSDRSTRRTRERGVAEAPSPEIRERPRTEIVPPDPARARRQRADVPLSVVALLGWTVPKVRLPPPPTERPTVPVRWPDELGGRREYPDRIGLRAALAAGRYADLTRWIEAWQRDFERDVRDEVMVTTAIDAFATADPSVTAQLDAWVAATPASWVPYAARAQFRTAVAVALRGGDFVANTAGYRMTAMERSFFFAREDITRALSIEPRAIAPQVTAIEVALYSGGDEVHAAFARTSQRCPLCVDPSLVYSSAMLPQWGGSAEAFAEFARRPRDVAANPRLRSLYGLADGHSCGLAADNGANDDAIAACTRALAAGPLTGHYRRRARAYRQSNRSAEAERDLQSALSIDPHATPVLELLSTVLGDLRRYEDGARVFLTLVRLEPAEQHRAEVLRWWLGRLRAEVTRLRLDGRSADAERHERLLDELTPIE